METRTASSAAVSEILNENNYVGWSVQVRTYLIAQDLWDIVEATNECPKQEDDEVAFKAWSKKNAMALHVIQISCPQRICHVISLITYAKIAWETLKVICSITNGHFLGMSFSILHMLKHFIPQMSLRYRRYNNELNNHKKLSDKNNAWIILHCANSKGFKHILQLKLGWRTSFSKR